MEVKKVKQGKTQITITFSQPLNGRNSGIDFGPLGADYFPKLSPNRVWSEDKKSITLEADLEPNKHYQFVVDMTFRNNEGIRIKPYLVEFTTKNKDFVRIFGIPINIFSVWSYFF